MMLMFFYRVTGLGHAGVAPEVGEEAPKPGRGISDLHRPGAGERYGEYLHTWW
jgi:hypothetical protein